jgi:hypothetical protein
MACHLRVAFDRLFTWRCVVPVRWVQLDEVFVLLLLRGFAMHFHG